MSEFDKEAEREKLRKQLEAEERDREATQRMSELLLGGATMTGKHCDVCGSPIFRKNGQEFCPTCRQTTTDQPHQATEGAGDQSEVDATTAEPAGVSPQAGQEGAPGAARPPTQPLQPDTTRPQQASDPSSPTTDSAPVAAPGAGSGDLDAARAALERKLARLATQAEATDDVSRARDLLAATREAAEALAALEQIERHTH